ncbi:MAG: hypothetical protein DRI73_02250, partial [Bacteroidetes bacterium]
MKHLITVALFILSMNLASGKEYLLISPDKKTEVNISTDTNLKIKLRYLSNELFTVDNISLNLADKSFSSEIKKIKKTKINSIKREIFPPIKEKFRVINDNFNELSITFKGDYSFIIRAYNNG